MGEYTHFDAEGRPTLVDVSDKAVTKRTAWAARRGGFSFDSALASISG